MEEFNMEIITTLLLITGSILVIVSTNSTNKMVQNLDDDIPTMDEEILNLMTLDECPQQNRPSRKG